MKQVLKQVKPRLPGFIAALQQGNLDTRDRRGRRHNLTFVLAGAAVALICGCRSLSSIHRFLCVRHRRLTRLLGLAAHQAVSRGHLPRLLRAIDRERLDAWVTAHFGTLQPASWVAVDGKVLRGRSSDGERQAVVFAVSHATRAEVARACQVGIKSSEVPVVRQLLQKTGLERQRVTLDALHCNPDTLGQIAAAGGTWLTQVKENQPTLYRRCGHRAQAEPPLAVTTNADKGHGRVTCWTARLYRLRADRHGQGTGMRFLVALVRETTPTCGGPTTREESYYVTNARGTGPHLAHRQALTDAIRGHWAVEANNGVRDVTLGEDKVRIREPNQAPVMALLRSLALAVLRRANDTHLQAVIERVAHVPRALSELLRRAAFL